MSNNFQLFRIVDYQNNFKMVDMSNKKNTSNLESKKNKKESLLQVQQVEYYAILERQPIEQIQSKNL